MLTAISESEYHYNRGLLDSITSRDCSRRIASKYYDEQQEVLESNDENRIYRMHPDKGEFLDTFDCNTISLDRIIRDDSGRIVAREQLPIDQQSSDRTYSGYLFEFDGGGRMIKKSYCSPSKPNDSFESWSCDGPFFSTNQYTDSTITTTEFSSNSVQLSDSTFDKNERIIKVMTYQCDSLSLQIRDSTNLFSLDQYTLR